MTTSSRLLVLSLSSKVALDRDTVRYVTCQEHKLRKYAVKGNMATLWIRFTVPLGEDAAQGAWPQATGVAFHRWAPNGVEDAIRLETGDPDAELRVWLEAEELGDPATAEWSVVWATSLSGHLIIQGLSDEDCGPLRTRLDAPGGQRETDEHYLALGIRVVHLLYGPIVAFLDTLRINYGQYWLPYPRPWDSREGPLGSYCLRVLRLEWRLGDTGPWSDFVPTSPTTQISGRLEADFGQLRQLLTDADWRQLETLVSWGYRPSLGVRLLAEAGQWLDQGDLRFALLLGVTALEVGIDAFIRRVQGLPETALDAVPANPVNPALLPLERRHEAVTVIRQVRHDAGRLVKFGVTRQLEVLRQVLILAVAPETLDEAAAAIKRRNELVHEGARVPETARQEIAALLQVGAALLEAELIRFPSRPTGHMRLPPEILAKQARRVSSATGDASLSSPERPCS